ncbi:MAG: selenite/tellurite reduction operon b-type cytochrome iron-sulfur cluster-binding subunit ExtO [Thermodesulfobacteriota bacterium]|nr:selenite/tellurite reduction operon b-type cytochrome iron-sulfur cluster-binding subunit ExtO [Thermodesulfobacteriota bacterium]
MFWKIVSIAFLLLAVSSAGAQRPPLKGVHATVPCSACHGDDTKTLPRPTSCDHRARGCVGCHQGYDAVFDQAMTTRVRERRFVEKTYGKGDPGFYQKNCVSCHVRDCLDCHGGNGHNITRPENDTCLSCHRGYFVGADYYGMAPREDHSRYQRGVLFKGETSLKMLPDVHAEAGMKCSDCHSMKSLVTGSKSSQKCVDCHKPDDSVIEHGIMAHLTNLECYACHSAWASQEYGSFYVRLANSPARRYFRVSRNSTGEYIKRAYLKRQNAPPLGTNSAGKVSPIRPQFISYLSDIRDRKPAGVEEENRLLAAQWKAFFPHTIRRGTVTCDGCHDNASRFVLEKKEDRVYQLQLDGMSLSSFWDQSGQEVVNGSFMEISRFARMSSKNPVYVRAYVKKWKRLVNRVEDSLKQ